MQTHTPHNATLIEYQGKNFFVDSGTHSAIIGKNPPVTISKEFSGLNTDFHVNGYIPPAAVRGLEEMLGCSIYGFLGKDFLMRSPVRINHSQHTLTFDDKPSGTPDITIPMRRPWIIQLEIDNVIREGFIDTGSMLTYRWDVSHAGRTQWRIPSFQGEITLHLYPATELKHNGTPFAQVITGHMPNTGRPMDIMIGANFLCQFDCYFDFPNQQLLLYKTATTNEAWQAIDSERRSCGFQYKFRGWETGTMEMVVSNHTHPNVTLPIGTVFSLPDIQTTSANVNRIFNALHPKSSTTLEVQTQQGRQVIDTVPFC